MFVIKVKSPEGETVDLLSTADENFAKGAQAGVAALLKFLENDMEFEEGFSCEVMRPFDTKASFWDSYSK
jgi:hypothetical protein